MHTAEVMQIEATSEVQTLIERNSSVKLLLDNKRKEVEALQQTTQKARDDARRILAICQQLVASEDAAFNAFLNSIPTDAPGQQMEDEISSEKARLELMHEGNGGVIKEYEQRQRKVESLKAKAEECKHALDELQDKIKEIREHWEPELDKLVEKISRSFSYNMGQINCAGEVGIFKDEQDFDEWAIQIRVKFRYVQPDILSLSSIVGLISPSALSLPRNKLTTATGKMNPSPSSTPTGSPVANAPSPQSSTSCPSNP